MIIQFYKEIQSSLTPHTLFSLESTDALAIKIAKAQLKKLPNPLKDIPNGPISGFTLFVKERYESVAKGDGFGGPKKASVDCIKELARIWKNDDSLKSVRIALLIFSQFIGQMGCNTVA